MRRPLALAAALVLALLAPARPGHAVEDDDGYDAALCEQAILNGARRGGVPQEVLHAIALTETGRKSNGRVRPYPWAINREGDGHWFKSREEALAFAKQSVADGRLSFDVGCVQINYRWHGHAFPTLEDMFDPEWTATYAAQFLRTLYEERGDWSQAAGAYHSLTAEKAAIYRQRFDRILAGLDPGALTEAETMLATAAPADRRSTRLARRSADRVAAARRIQAEGPPPPAVMGSLSGVQTTAPLDGGLLVGGAGPMLTPGAPMLSQGAQPLFTPAGGGLF